MLIRSESTSETLFQRCFVNKCDKKERKTHFHEISLALFYRTRQGEEITRQFNNLAFVVPLKKRPFAK